MCSWLWLRFIGVCAMLVVRETVAGNRTQTCLLNDRGSQSLRAWLSTMKWCVHFKHGEQWTKSGQSSRRVPIRVVRELALRTATPLRSRSTFALTPELLEHLFMSAVLPSSVSRRVLSFLRVTLSVSSKCVTCPIGGQVKDQDFQNAFEQRGTSSQTFESARAVDAARSLLRATSR